MSDPIEDRVRAVLESTGIDHRLLDCDPALADTAEGRLEIAERHLADATHRQRIAQEKADGRRPLGPGMGSPAHWKTEARRLAELVATEQAKVDAARAALAVYTDPF